MWLRFARRTPTTAVTTGVVVVEGRVVAVDRTLSIPGSTSRPVFHETAFESFKAVPGGRGRAAWQVDRIDRQVVPFLVEDEAGRILVDVDREEVEVKGGRREVGSTGKNAQGRYSARMIFPGDVIRVRGEAYEPKRSPVPRGLRAGTDRPLEILFRKEGDPPPEPVAAPAPPRAGKKKRKK
jgi:hypothetical protein